MNLTSQILKANESSKVGIVEEGVTAYKDGKYWGCQYSDGQTTEMDFGPLENATITNPKYCLSPLYMARGGINANGPDQRKLKDAKLVRVRKITVIENLGDV